MLSFVISGIILHFNDPGLYLSGVYFINPQWLCQMMARVVTVKEMNRFISSKGILHKRDAVHLFKGQQFPEQFIDTYFR